MKDKRIYLKLACLLEIFYIFLMLFYYLFFTKYSDEVLANVFFLIISFVFTVLLYKESKKDINNLKKNKFIVLLASIWLFFDPVIPGILGFIFLSKISDKKKIELPKKDDIKINNKFSYYIKPFLLILIFIALMFILPNFSLSKKIPSYLIYIFMIILVLLLNYKELYYDLKLFKNNIKSYLPFIIKRYLYMICIMIIVAIPVVLINNGSTSNNQAIINAMFKKVPLATFVLSTLYAPFVEENVFRLSLSKFFNNKTLFIILSGVFFGSLHVIDNFTSLNDFLYIFQYSALGICLAKAYSDSKNIFVPISMHFIQNFLAAIIVLLVY